MNQRLWTQWIVAAALAVTACTVHATDLAVAADTYVDSNRPTANFGAQSNLRVKPTAVALLAFDLSSLPSGTTASQVSKATLWLYVNRIDSSNAIVVKPITSSWNESAVTYNAAPTTGSQFTTFTPTAAQQFIAVDVTTQVQSWITTPSGNYGLALTAAVADMQFDSKENDENSHAPRLDITLAGATGATGAAATVTIGTTTTGAAGTSASVTNSGSTSAAVFNFTIPAGAQGVQGAQGIQGIQGIQGLTGATGAKGDKGDTGATGTIGAVTEYNAATTYATGQVVYCSTACATAGSSYISLQDGNLSKDPSDSGSSAYWQLIAKAGAGLTASSTAGQLYLTGTGGAIPTAPVSMSGDVTITSGGVATIGSSAITTAKINDGAVTAAKIATGAVTTNQIAASAGITGTQIAAGTITGANSGSGNIASNTITGSNIADTSIGVAKINATGTASSSTFLRGDGTWNTPSGGTGFTMLASYVNQNNTDTYYLSPIGAANSKMPNEQSILVPSACTVTSLFVRGQETESSYLSTNTTTITVRKNGSDTTMTCTLSNSSAVLNAVATCSDTTHTFTVAAHDVLELKFVQDNSAPVIAVSTALVCQ